MTHSNDNSEGNLGYNDWLSTALSDEEQQKVVDLVVSERQTIQKVRKEHKKKQITEKRTKATES